MAKASRWWRAGALSNMLTVHPKRAMKELYVFSLFFAFASALITIFEPIFFYRQAFSLSSIALYYAIHYTSYAILLPLGGKFAARYGLEKSLTVCLPMYVLYLALLAAMPEQKELFWIAPLFLTGHKLFYWPALHASLARAGDKANRGTELSWFDMLRYGVGIIGPLTGGFVAMYFGFPMLFLVAAIAILCSAWPLVRTKEIVRPMSFPYSAPWKIITSRKHRGMALAMMGMGENFIDLVFWPIFMFIILGSTDKVGIFSAFTVGVMVLISFGIGELSDHFSRRSILRLHIPFMMIGYLFRPLAVSPLRLVLTDLLNKTAYVGVNLPMVYRLYEQATKAGDIRYTTAFELMLAVTKAVTAFAFAFIFASVLPYTGFSIGFVWSALVSAMYLFL